VKLRCTLALLGFWLSACAAADEKFSTAPEDCDDLSAETLEGEWQLTAKGKRFDCDGARQEGTVDLEVPPFVVIVRPEPTEGPPVIETGDEADAFVERVRKADLVLTANIDDDVEFEGQGAVDCGVSFTLTETLSSGETLSYDFDGFVRDDNEATGTFTGSGPGKCKVSGEFSLERR